MDKAALASAASEMRRIAEDLVPLLLAGEDARLDALRVQWESAETRISEPSAWGFFLDISVPPDLPRIDVRNQGGGDACIPVAGCDQPSGCVLYIVDGALSFLEVYTVVEWEAPLIFGAPSHVQGLTLKPDIAATTPG